MLPGKELNDVSIEVIKKEIGTQGWDLIVHLTHFLFTDYLSVCKYSGLLDKFVVFFTTGKWPRISSTAWGKQIPSYGRFAPSVVTRTEVGVFGTSMPRFCYRLNFENSEGFINVRRLKTLQTSLKDIPEMWSAKRLENLTANESHPRIKDQLKVDENFMHDGRDHSVIADCVLKAPKRYPDLDYHILGAKIFADYGETLDKNAEGTPFIKTVDFGGGLCAQACALVCTTLMNEFSKGMHGLSEVTAMASSPDLKELLIAGLTEDELVTYFQSVGLAAIPQFSNPNMQDLLLKARLNADYTQALHGYVISGMPIILFVDMSRLNGKEIGGQSIYDANGFEMAADPKYVYHAVTVVGCSRWNDARNGKSQIRNFLIMDSATLPFLKASSDQIAEVGSWENMADGNKNLRHPIAIPVTPREVKLPLLSFRKVENSKGWTYGLIELSNRCCFHSIDPKDRQFILTTVAKIPFIKVCKFFPAEYYVGVSCLLCRTLAEETAARFGWNQEHWIWLECGPNVVRVWDAEAVCSSHYEIEKVLLGVINLSNNQVGIAFIQPPENTLYAPLEPEKFQLIGSMPKCTPSKVNASQLKKTRYALKPSLITSFTVHGLHAAAERWDSIASSVDFVEAYICMQTDLVRFFGKTKEDRAVKVMAEQYHISGADELFAKNLKELFGKRKIIAFASFIPEILSPNPSIYEEAQCALKFLVKTASFLQDSKNGPFTIELVGGSRLQGIWNAATTEEEPALAVNRLDVKIAHQTLLARLGDVAEEASKHKGIQLALESEPGPLFACDPYGGINKGWPNVLKDLCAGIAASPQLRNVVGLNLDIAHWGLLSKIDVNWIRHPDNSVVRDRIIHAHISDHGRGHFSDNAIGTCNEPETFVPWLSFLDEIAHDERPKGGPRFSGIVSCEIEACKRGQFIEKALSEFKNLMFK